MRLAMEMAQGFRLAWHGIAFLGRHRTLWTWAILPTVINMMVFTLAFALFVFFYQDIYGLATGFLPQTPPQAWYAWFWVAPLRFLGWGIGLLVLLTALVVLYTSWSMMGRFGLVSLGHGGFMGIGAYVTALLWNHAGVSPWIGIPLALLASGVLAVVVAYPCFRFRIIGHYFALVTLALSGIVLQVITATRDWTGGSLGYTPERYQGGSPLYALQFTSKEAWYLIALGVWAAGLYIWRLVDRSMLRYALEAISEDEDGAAAAGVHVTAEKLKITVLSAVMTALAGALYCQYQMFISPDTVSGIAISLQMVFAVVVGGIYVSLGPTVGAVITIMLAEVLRISFGTRAVGWDNLVYGVLLVVFIIFLPKGILGSLLDLKRPRAAATLERSPARSP
jgi:branched-chain amino acid transport system permease protein